MNAKITRPSQQFYLPTITIYSPAKVGKSLISLTVGRNELLILDAQHGTDWMRHPKLDPNVWHISNYSEWEEAYYYLRDRKHPYKWVSNDTITKLHNLALRKVLGVKPDVPLPSGISLPKRGAAGEHTKLMIDNFRRLPMGVIFIAGERRLVADTDNGSLLDSEELGNDEIVEESPNVRYVPDLPDDTRKYLVQESDVIGRLFITPPKDGQRRGKRHMWLAPHSLYETGYRSYYPLPDYMSQPNLKRLISLTQRGSNNAEQ
ncbi:MAG: ATP-binding protein [Acidobacteria bacterium]|nr:ATP-binding protein [Acidobacteriota bacterium]